MWSKIQLLERIAYPSLQNRITNKSAIIYNELKSVLAAAPLDDLFVKQSKEKRRNGHMLISPREWNRWIAIELLKREWVAEVPLLGRSAVDFKKGPVVVEIQFGKYAYNGEILHWKFPLVAKQWSDVEMCVLVLPTLLTAKWMSSGVGTFDHTLRYYVDPARDRLTYKTVVIGMNAYHHHHHLATETTKKKKILNSE